MCCAASCAAPCAMPSCSARGAADVASSCRRWCARWARPIPELIRAEALITETLKLEETRFRKTLERGLAILDEETQGAQARRQARGRDRVHALRHLRLSARPHAGRAARRAASASTSTASTPRWSSSARRRARPGRARARPRPRPSGSRCARSSARPSSSATRPRRAEGVVAALVRDGKEVAELKAGRERRGRPQPDAVLRRVRRPGRRHRRA